MAPHRGERRLHHNVPLSARRARRFLRARRAGTAAPRTVPARIRRQDLARESRIAAPDEPFLRDPQGCGMEAEAQTGLPTQSPRGSKRRSTPETAHITGLLRFARNDELTGRQTTSIEPASEMIIEAGADDVCAGIAGRRHTYRRGGVESAASALLQNLPHALD